MERTIKGLKDQGLVKDLDFQIVEYYNYYAKKRIDLFSIIDILVLGKTQRGIQVCSSDFKSHYNKIMVEKVENTLKWLESGATLEVHGWRKKKKVRGKKATFWSPRVADVYIFHGELTWEERKET